MVTEKPRINRQMKDRLFRMVFHSKEELLDLYNAINGTSYSNADELEINTLDDAIYMGMKNDASFLIANYMNLYEHQSTFNPNMPFRGFLYFADLYRKYVVVKKLNLYSSSIQKFPLPQYFVFYNGTKREQDRTELKLSDAFENVGKGIEPCLEVKVVMLNINLGHNWELMEKCRRLKEYAQFVSGVRANMEQGMTPEEAAAQAVETCIQSGILEDLLRAHKAEVIDMILTEYDEQEHMELERVEWEAKGEKKAILILLEEMGSVSDKIKTIILEQNDPDILSGWIKLAAKVSSAEEFESLL